jgi:hypothetical protein
VAAGSINRLWITDEFFIGAETLPGASPIVDGQIERIVGLVRVPTSLIG